MTNDILTDDEKNVDMIIVGEDKALRSRVDELTELRCFIARNPKRQVGLMDYDKATNCCVKLLCLLDRAMQGLDGYADYANNAEKICDERGYYSGDRLSLTEIPEACPTLGMLRKSRQTLAEIRKQLGDTND